MAARVERRRSSALNHCHENWLERRISVATLAAAQRVEVLRRPAEGRPPAGHSLVARARAARRAAGRVRRRDGRARRRGERRREPGVAARLRRHGVRPAPGADADSPGGQRQPRRPHGRVAVRPADRGVRPPAGHGPPRGSDAHQRPDRRARLRPRHDRAAAVDLDGLHRRRPGRDDRRPRVRAWCSFAYAWWAPLVLGGAWLATHWLLRESAVWRDRNTDEVRGAQRDADYAYRLAVDPRARQGAAAVRPRRLDDRSLRRRAARACTRCSTRRRGCARSRCCGACCSSSAPTSSCSGRSPAPRRAAASTLGAGRRVRAERGRHVDDRVRRAELGARRRGGAGGRGAAPRAGDGAGRRAAVRQPRRPPACPRARSASAT